MNRPIINHSELSPSGHVSKRARDAARKRQEAEGAEYWVHLVSTHTRTESERAADEAIALRRSAANLRDLASRGMKPRAYAKEANRLEAEAATLEAS